MKRPCSCDNCPIGEPWIPRRDCRHCWLYWNHPGYRRLWTLPADGPPAPMPPARGPGSELKALLVELGITNFAGCGCDAKAKQMNEWGVAGCQQHFATIRGWIAEAQAKASWTTTINATIAAATTGIGLQIDPADVAGSLVRLAISRADTAMVPLAASSLPDRAAR